MEVADFVGKINQLTGKDLEAIGRAIQSRSDAIGEQVDAWRVSMSIDKAIKENRMSVLASYAVGSATRAVQHVALKAGWDKDDERLPQIVRAAAEIARGIVVGSEVEVEVKSLLSFWEPSFARHDTLGHSF